MTARDDEFGAWSRGISSRGEVLAAVEVALLDNAGVIVETNAAWDEFCLENDGDLTRAGVGISYLDACAAARDDPAAYAVADAIRVALRGDLPAPLSILVPCDAPNLPRVFNTLISSRLDDSGTCIGATVTLSRASVEGEPGLSWPPDPIPALLRLAELVADEVYPGQTLRRVADSVRDVLRVSFVAVRVTGSDAVPEELEFAGIDAHTAGALDGVAAALEWLAAKPRFLGLPIVVGGRQIGALYLGGDLPGRFPSPVERLAAAFADAAGTAIENARLYHTAKQDHRWAEAAAELTHDLVSGATVSPLDLVLRHAARAAEADLAAVLVPEDETRIRLHAIVGGMQDLPEEKLFPREGSPAADVMSTGKPLLLKQPTARVHEVSDEPMGPIAVVPLTDRHGVIGALVASRRIDRPRFTATDMAALMRFTNYAGIALELDQARADREHLGLHDDRARIAIELHDHVVRQLFAVGMGLEGLSEVIEDAELRGRIASYVTALDDSIRGIRETIYHVRDV